MTFRDYIGAIAEYVNGGQTQLVVDLFKTAGAIKDVEFSTASSWIRSKGSKGYRRCTIRDYFPDDKLDEKYFIKFLKDRVNTSWKELQETFRSINDDDIVDVDTINQDLFYWSLLNQFQKIHGLPLSERPTAPISTTSNNEFHNSTPHREMIRIFKETSEYYQIINIINCEPSLIGMKLLPTHPDLLSLATRFVEDIQAELITPFDTYKGEILYIKISQFVTLVTKYREYLKRKLPHYGFPHISSERLGNINPLPNASLPDTKSEFEIETEHYQAKLKSLYDEIYNSDID